MNWNKAGIFSVNTTQDSHPPQPQIPAFAPIVSDAFEHLKHLPERTHLPSGAVLVEQGDTVPAVYLILSGLVKLVSTNAEGRQATVGLRTSGWYAGASNVMINTVSVYAVTALTSCTVVRIPASEFSLTLMQSAKMMRHFIATLSHELISLASAQAEVMSASAEERLSTFMRERTTDHSQWRVLDALPLLKQVELAQLLAITPEHLSRLLHKTPSAQGGRSKMDDRKSRRPPNAQHLATDRLAS